MKPNSKTFAAWLHDYFKKLRFNKKHHLGLGDIRLTMAQQDVLVVMAEQVFNNKRSKA